jgi:hypothetical protein
MEQLDPLEEIREIRESITGLQPFTESQVEIVIDALDDNLNSLLRLTESALRPDDQSLIYIWLYKAVMEGQFVKRWAKRIPRRAFA